MSKTKLNPALISFIILVILGSGFFYLSKRGERVFEIKPVENNGGKETRDLITPSPEEENLNRSPISGSPCENYNRRPFAVMLAEDPETRPLSGISQADLVIEMPVITGSITRMMAIFQCQSPSEIGSLRSARHDFIPLAMGLDAVFIHWGGSHYALDKLKKKIIDNIDALPNPYNTFWRKKDIPPPHNGFTSMDNLLKAVKKMGYRLESNFEGYSHFVFEGTEGDREGTKWRTPPLPDSEKKGRGLRILEINYPPPFNIKYEYDPETNSYLRWRGGGPEIDKLNWEQVKAKNIVIMRAFSRQIEGEYNDVDIEGEGRAAIYQNGEEIKGSWQKDKLNPSSKLYFYDERGEEVKFLPGVIWIEVVEPYQKVTWQIPNS